MDAVPKSYLNGDRNERLPNVINFRFSSIEGESLILLLDAKGYQASTGSACSSKTLEASPVLKALNLDDVDVHGSLRISLGSQTHFDDVDGLVEAIKESVATLRKMSPLWNSDENSGEMENPDGVGTVGNPTCGDLMTIYIKVKDDVITDISFQTFGCGAAIATSSMITEIAIGKTLEEALKISRNDVAEELDGLPPVKMHCSNLAADALKAAIDNYYENSN